MRRFRAIYGSTPLHLIAVTAAVAISGYAASKIASTSSGWEIALWFIAAIALHDLVLFPLYTLLDRVAQGRAPRAAVNYVRVPAVISAILLLISLGLVCSVAPDTYENATGLRPTPYFERWLAVTATLFVVSGVAFAVRARSS